MPHRHACRYNPHLVAEYIQFNDSRPFELLQLQCVVEDLVKTESMYGKLTLILQYWLHYEHYDKHAVLSFGLVESIIVNPIVGIPTIKAWKLIFDFESNKLVAQGVNTRIPLLYEANKHSLSFGVTFFPSDFVRSIQDTTQNAKVLLTNFNNTINTPTHLWNNSAINDSKVGYNTETASNGYICWYADIHTSN